MKKPLADIFKAGLKIAGIILLFLVFRNIEILIPLNALLPTFVTLIIISLFRYQTTYSIKRRNDLAPADLKRIKFAKEWFKVRQEGMWKFLLIDGAIISGALLSLCICLIMFFLVWTDDLTSHLSSPGDIFTLIGYSYLAGSCLALVLNRVIWYLNERKFIRITDPLT